MKSAEIRDKFLRYFESKGHTIVASSPLVPGNDPTLLFTNSGMVQFKDVFLGQETRPYKRATTSQRSLRAGGKHNDLENVGYTARHHTFFEMLGNFSFGDYFKERAIELAWNLITKELGLPADRLLVTVFAEDDDAAGFWRKITGFPDSRIIRIPTSDNFWAMGDTGPCGPCSEIFFDHGEGIPGGPPGSPDQDGDRFIEIWNLVFMQYEQVTREERVNLPKPSIDTGMGLERIAAVLQGVHDNYDIDLFRTLIEAVAHETGVDPDGPQAASHKVIADHLRATSFLIADGVLPSNEGRGYVLRRIMRRGMRHAQLLGAREPLLWRLVPILIDQMGKAFPELVRAEALITEVLKLEETSFRRTLERGLRLLEDETGQLAAGAPLAGEVAFRLYDTYGFPLDLTQDALRAQGRTVDTGGFDAAMARQREAARAAWKGSGESAVDPIWFDLRESLGATEFLGYATTHAEGVVTALVVDGQPVQRAEPGPVTVITNQTPFYGESGGQIGDTGTIRAGDAVVTVSDTQKRLGDLWVHIGTLAGGALAVGDAVELAADATRRDRIRRAHSATHLLHAALRRHLGRHVAQKGSLVAPDRLRFDFSQPRPMSPDELRAVEAEVNHFLRRNDEAAVRIMSRDDAIGSGAMALFGEKYGDEVRVVSMGVGEDGKTYSVELCGGTHVRRTGDIALFRIVSESAVAAGVRRVEAVTGELAYDEARREHDLLDTLAQSLKVAPADLPARLEALVEERRKLEREAADLRRKIAVGGGGGPSANGFKQVGEIKFAARTLEGVPAKELRGTADAIKQELGSGVVALVSVNDGKAAVVVSVTPDLA
ncbi:MAG: alanine--tRNA ligase, partial [Burkholderiales bacterium]|nr:alanine--tRNA ligase [Burkholderiales bacterium]